MSLLGRLSVVGPPPAARRDAADLAPAEREALDRSHEERTYPVACRNLGLPCPEERTIYARQQLARAQAEEIRREVEALPLKGLHLAHHVYPTPGLRDMGDLDLLVRRERRGEADAALRRLGYVAEFEPDRVDGGSLNAVAYWREESMPVHLHWHVSNASLPHFMYRVDVDEIWREARDGVLARPHLVVTLCEHALKHSFAELIHLTDLEIASRGVDWGRVAATARRWGLERAVYYALVLLRDLMEVDAGGLGEFAGVRLDWSGRAFLSLARSRRWNGLSALGLLSMTREKGRFVRETFVPPKREGLRTRSLIGRLWRAAGGVGAALTS